MSRDGLAIVAFDDQGARLRAEVAVAPGGRWFEDHFPGSPVLPAIAHFDLVGRVHRAGGGSGRIAHLDRVRLTAPVRPGDRLEVVLERTATDAWSFRLRSADGSAVSDGLVRWAAPVGAAE